MKYRNTSSEISLKQRNQSVRGPILFMSQTYLREKFVGKIDFESLGHNLHDDSEFSCEVWEPIPENSFVEDVSSSKTLCFFFLFF